MTSLAHLDYGHTAALYRGDGSGIAVIARDRGEGACWARVVESGAGIPEGYLHLYSRYSGEVDGRLIIENEVTAVPGTTAPGPPDALGATADGRSLGTYFEEADPEHARRADAALAEESRAGAARIAAQSFDVSGAMDDRTWRVRVGPTHDGRTSLTCQAEGELRVLYTTAARELLDSARSRPVAVSATYSRRRRFGAPRARDVTITLSPTDDQP